jgi:hypothetical protein
MAENDASAPDSFPMGVRADEMMTEPGMVPPQEQNELPESSRMGATRNQGAVGASVAA